MNEEFLNEKILYSWVLKIGFVQINLFLLSFFLPFKLNTFIGFILESVTFEKCGIYNIYTCDGDGEVLGLKMVKCCWHVSCVMCQSVMVFYIYVIYSIGWILLVVCHKNLYSLQRDMHFSWSEAYQMKTLHVPKETKLYFVCIQWYYKCSANYF